VQIIEPCKFHWTRWPAMYDLSAARCRKRVKTRDAIVVAPWEREVRFVFL